MLVSSVSLNKTRQTGLTELYIFTHSAGNGIFTFLLLRFALFSPVFENIFKFHLVICSATYELTSYEILYESYLPHLTDQMHGNKIRDK